MKCKYFFKKNEMYLCGNLWRMVFISLNWCRNFFLFVSIVDIRIFFNLVVLYESKFVCSVVLLYLVIGVDV